MDDLTIIIIASVAGVFTYLNYFATSHLYQLGAGVIAVLFSFWYRQKNNMTLTFRQAQMVGIASYILGWVGFEALDGQIENLWLRMLAGAFGALITMEVMPTLVVALPELLKLYGAKKLGIELPKPKLRDKYKDDT